MKKEKNKRSFVEYFIVAFILQIIYLFILNLVNPINVYTINFLNYHLFIISFILAGFCFYFYLFKKDKTSLFYLMILVVVGVILGFIMVAKYTGEAGPFFVWNIFLAVAYFFISGIILYLLAILAIFILNKFEL